MRVPIRISCIAKSLAPPDWIILIEPSMEQPSRGDSAATLLSLPIPVLVSKKDQYMGAAAVPLRVYCVSSSARQEIKK